MTEHPNIDVKTHGGAYVNDVSSSRDFIGRDSITNIYYQGVDFETIMQMKREIDDIRNRFSGLGEHKREQGEQIKLFLGLVICDNCGELMICAPAYMFDQETHRQISTFSYFCVNISCENYNLAVMDHNLVRVTQALLEKLKFTLPSVPELVSEGRMTLEEMKQFNESLDWIRDNLGRVEAAEPIHKWLMNSFRICVLKGEVKGIVII